MGRVCLSSLFSDFSLPPKDKKGKSNCCICLPSLDRPTLVPVVTGALLRPTTAPASGALSIDLAVERSASPAENGRITVSRVEALGRRYRLQGFSAEVDQLLLEEFRPSTESAYESTWRNWMRWCIKRGKNPLSTYLGNILEFLSSLRVAGKAYNTIDVHRSMLSMTLDSLEGGGGNRRAPVGD